MRATIQLLALSFFSFLASVSLAQIPNQGFENWSSVGFPSRLDPDGWGTLNGSTWLGGIGAVTCERGSGADVHGGTYSMKLTSKSILGLGDAPGITVTTAINTSTQAFEGGFVYTQRPEFLAGWFKYAPAAGDTGEISIWLWKRNAGVYELVGEGKLRPTGATATFTRFMIPITYSSANAPDSARIAMISTNTDNIQLGSTLIVDDLQFVSCAGFSVTTAATDETIHGANNGTVNATATGGAFPHTFLWSNGDITEDLASLSSGNYCVTVTDANGCTVSSCALVAGPDCSGFSVSTTASDESAPGAGDGAVYTNVSGGILPLSYLWSNGGTGQDYPGLTSGNYCVTVTDSVGCTASSCSIVSSPACAGFSITLTGTDPTVVGGTDGTVSVTPTGGIAPYSFNWDTPGTTGLAAGHYCVTVTDTAFCVDTGCITLSDPDCSSFAVTANGTDASSATANDGAISATPANGTAPYQYSWSNLASDSAVTSVPAGTYTVTVSDNAGCTASDDVTIGPDCSGFGVTVTTDGHDDIPFSGTASTDVTGGTSPFTYLWNTGDTFQNLDSLDIANPGNYCATVTDANGCTASDCDSLVIIGSVGNIAEAGIKIFPNPAQNVITVQLKNQDSFRFRLFDATGKMVMEQMLSSQSNVLSLRGFAAGNYIVELQQAATGKSFSGKLRKE